MITGTGVYECNWGGCMFCIDGLQDMLILHVGSVCVCVCIGLV